MKVRPRIVAVAGVLLLVSGMVLFFAVPAIMKQQVTAKVQIDPDNGLAYTMWRDIPVPFYMSLYFFEVKNPQEMLQGEKPVVDQRGPYVYREYRQKSNITFHNNYTVSYREYRRYHFCPEWSAGNESDELVLPNMLVLYWEGLSLCADDLESTGQKWDTGHSALLVYAGVYAPH
ncbi:scavenger receptor class B member 1-like [Heterodontus francisci]|uniref:scavenger receptor class B member 1-like n=1 Tax=Heterodontus francisci TaxID=7792 RepID=UPI00355B9400